MIDLQRMADAFGEENDGYCVIVADSDFTAMILFKAVYIVEAYGEIGERTIGEGDFGTDADETDRAIEMVARITATQVRG